MIRKFGRIHAPPDLVRSIFIDAEAWPGWQAGVTESIVLQQTETMLEVEVDGRFMGQRMHGTFDCRIDPDGFYQHQRVGWLKKWDTQWRFLVPPDGRGTTLVCELEIDAGLLGALVPRSFMQRFVERVFSETVDSLNTLTAEIASAAIPRSVSNGESEILLEIFETPVGYEILVGGRRINLESKDP